MRDAGQEGQSGSTEAAARFTAMGAGRMHKWGAMGNGQCPKQVVAVRRGLPSLEKQNYVLKRGRRRNWGASSRGNSPFFKGEGAWEQPVWICYGKCCLSNLIAFYHDVSVPVDEVGAVGKSPL